MIESEAEKRWERQIVVRRSVICSARYPESAASLPNTSAYPHFAASAPR